MPLLDQPGVLYPDVIRYNAKFYGSRMAVICGDERLTWKEFHLRTNKVANALIGRGLKKGDRVCFVMENSVSAFELIWGAIKAGGVVAPLNVMMAAESLPVMINNASPRFLFVDTGLCGMVASIRNQLRVEPSGFYAGEAVPGAWQSFDQLVESGSTDDVYVDIEPSDSMTVLYSSGTTGVPKGSEHSHAARLMYPFGCGAEMTHRSVTLCATPLYTNGTWILMLPSIFLGGATVLARKLTPQFFLETIAKEKITHVFVVPTQCIGILESDELQKHDTSSLKMMQVGGGPTMSTTFAGLKAAFPQTSIYEIYGISEGWITIALPEDRESRRGTVGKPIFGGDVCVINADGVEVPPGETGELAGWSAGLMKGYMGDPERTKEMIWVGPNGRTYLRSGDLGYMDKDGFLFVNGRVKDMIVSGGVNVFSSDIEDVFIQHPAVLEVSVIGVPHEKWGETPLLLAILREGAQISAEELKEWGNVRLGKFQRVSAVEFRDEFPRANYGKILKRVLRQPYWEGRERSI